MLIKFHRSFTDNIVSLMRSVGYAPFTSRKTGKDSFVRKVGGAYYPRFHVYVNRLEKDYLEIDIHFDAKAHTYKGFSAHVGEYDSELVQKEANRIAQALSQLSEVSPPAKQRKNRLSKTSFGGIYE